MIRSLLKEDVNLIYGYPGGAIMPIYDELYKFQDKLNHVLTRHEQGATHAAQGFSRVSGKVGVVMATSGPGATNLITGIADAQIDSTPMVCITGQVASHLLGSDAFQETDIIGISTPVTKWNCQVTKAADIPIVLAKAFYIAKSGRPGPVLIDITKDAQFEMMEYSYKKCNSVRSYNPVPDYSIEMIKKATKLIDNAKKPFIVFGQGVILGNAEQEFKDFIEKTGIPAAWTILGLSALPTDHRLNVGMVGMHGNYGPNVLTNECDLLIAIGMRFDDRVTGNLNTYAKQAKIFHMEIDPAEINKNVECDVPILGNIKSTLPVLNSMVKNNSHDTWLNEFSTYYKKEYNKVIDKEINPSKDGLTMAEVIKEINLASNGDAIIVTDVGQHQMVACRYAKFNKSKSNVTSGGLGTMGFALPAALGAKMGAPNREVVAVIGDGGYQMTIQELGTIFQTNSAVKIVVLNNDFLGMVRQWQELLHGGRYSESYTDSLPDFVKLAESYKAVGLRAKKPEELDDVINEMISTDKTVIADIWVSKEENCFPMIQSGSAHNEMVLSKDQKQDKLSAEKGKILV